MRNKNHIEPKVKTPDSNVDNDPEKLKESPRFGERLEYLLYISGLSRKDFCLKTALDTAHFYRMTKGKTDPGYETLKRIAEAFPRISINWMITGKGPIESIYEEPEVMGLIEQESFEVDLLRRSLGAMEGSTHEISERLFGKLLELQHVRRRIVMQEGTEDSGKAYLESIGKRISRLVTLRGEDAKNLFYECFENGDEVWSRLWKSLIELGGDP